VKRFLFGTKQREEESYDEAEAVPDLQGTDWAVESLTETSRRPPQVGHLGVPRCYTTPPEGELVFTLE